MNINDDVSVRLTEDGVSAHRAYFKRLLGDGYDKFAHPSMPVAGAALRMPLWYAMQIFGPSMSALGPQLFVDNEMTIAAP